MEKGIKYLRLWKFNLGLGWSCIKSGDNYDKSSIYEYGIVFFSNWYPRFNFRIPIKTERKDKLK